MSDFNLIKVKQLDSEIASYILDTVSGNFGDIILGYLSSGGSLLLGGNVVYTDASTQYISGEKNFLVSPGVPYSGESGQAISKQYVDDQTSGINAVLGPFLAAGLVYATGNQTIGGVKTFTQEIVAPLIGGAQGNNNAIDLAGTIFLDSSSQTALNWSARTLKGTWGADAGFTVGGFAPILVGGEQEVTGDITFAGSVYVNSAIENGNPVSYGQLNSILQSSFLANAGSTSGFGGVLSFNGSSGNIFSQGRGNVTCWQQGNIFNISGAPLQDLSTTDLNLSTYELPSGYDTYTINFSQTFTAQPFVLALVGFGNQSSIIPYNIFNVNPTGFSIAFGAQLPNSGYYVNYLAYDQTGILNTLQGQQGPLGPYLIPVGGWETGQNYGFLNFVTIDGVSWAAITGHTATTGNGPLSVSGSSYWQLLASGTGPQGNDGVIFGYAGTWQNFAEYDSGDAVTYLGQSYATLEDVSVGISPLSGAPWFVIAAQGAPGTSFQFFGDFSSTINYSGGAVVRANHTTYVLPLEDEFSIGVNQGPTSLNSIWSKLENRNIVFNGAYSPTNTYYKNDLVSTSTGFNVGQVVQYINTIDYPIVSFYPFGYYNLFTDCQGSTGTNLMQLGTEIKEQYHTLYSKGSISGFNLNSHSVNENASGWGIVPLVIGETYYFQNNTNLPIILTTDPNGGTFNNQFIGNCLTGTGLLIASSGYEQMGLETALKSGVLFFTPDNTSPKTFYLQSPVSADMGIRFVLLQQNPWQVFSSGVAGIQGPTGETGPGGLAFEWLGDFQYNLPYHSGQAVYYNGSSYVTFEDVTYTNPTDDPWQIIAQGGADGENGQNGYGLGFTWMGTWNNSTAYIPYNAVYWNGSSYATSGSPFGNYPPDTFPEYWFIVAQSGAPGIQGTQGIPGVAFAWHGTYSNTTSYASGSAVFYNGSSYVTQSGISGVAPTGFPWQTIAAAGGSTFGWVGAWNSGVNYFSGQSVYRNGSTYATLSSSTNADPATGSNSWFVIAQGSTGIQGPSGAQGIQGIPGLSFGWSGEWISGHSYPSYTSVFWDGSSYGTTGNISGAFSSLSPDNLSGWFVIAQQGDPGLSFNWRGPWNAGTIYPAYSAVSYLGQSYGCVNFSAAGIIPDGSGAPWYILAERGGQASINNFFYPTLQTGLYVYEAFYDQPSLFTGLSIGIALDNGSRANISGTVYVRYTDNTTSTELNFTIPPATNYFVLTGSFPVYSQQRVGLALSGCGSGYTADVQGVSIGFFATSIS